MAKKKKKRIKRAAGRGGEMPVVGKSTLLNDRLRYVGCAFQRANGLGSLFRFVDGDYIQTMFLQREIRPRFYVTAVAHLHGKEPDVALARSQMGSLVDPLEVWDHIAHGIEDIDYQTLKETMTRSLRETGASENHIIWHDDVEPGK
jgi:hypothetical protein